MKYSAPLLRQRLFNFVKHEASFCASSCLNRFVNHNPHFVKALIVTPNLIKIQTPATLSPHMPEKLLLVDDDESIIAVCEVALRKAGYNVSVASNGEQALKLAEGEVFDLVLTDLHMPGSIDGGGVVRGIKARHPG